MARKKEETPLSGEINMTLPDFVVSILESKIAWDRLKTTSSAEPKAENQQIV
jgi:hypothetical protein